MENKEILTKLAGIQQELRCPKNQRNNFGGYNFRNAEDIMESVKPLLSKYKTTLILSDVLQFIEGRFYVMAVATIYDLESDGFVSTSAYAREEETKKGMDASQITGASSSYARKYALNGLFLIDDVKDSDTTNKGSNGDVVLKTKADAEKYVIDFGKHAGKTIKELVENEKTYCNWLYVNGDENVKKALNLMLDKE